MGARAGQYVHVRTVEAGGLPVRRPFPIVTADAASGTLTIHGPGAPPGGGWLDRLRPGDTADMIGPLGRPFEVDPRSRHLLLMAEGPGVGAVRLLVDEAVRDGRSVTLLFGARSSADVYPTSLLPDEVEYVVATADGSLGHRGSVLDLVLDYEAWADQAFAAGSLALLDAIAAPRRRAAGTARRGDARPQARWRTTPRGRIPRGAAEGVAPGARRRPSSAAPRAPASAAWSPVRAARSGPAAKARSFAATELEWEPT